MRCCCTCSCSSGRQTQPSAPIRRLQVKARTAHGCRGARLLVVLAGVVAAQHSTAAARKAPPPESPGEVGVDSDPIRSDRSPSSGRRRPPSSSSSPIHRWWSLAQLLALPLSSLCSVPLFPCCWFATTLHHLRVLFSFSCVACMQCWIWYRTVHRSGSCSRRARCLIRRPHRMDPASPPSPSRASAMCCGVAFLANLGWAGPPPSGNSTVEAQG